jgi:peroxiredoxin
MAATEPAAATAPVPEARAGARGLFRKYRWVAELGVVVAVYFGGTAYQGRHLVGTGTEAPAFALTALDGSAVSLDSLRGKRVLLHFWATWCGVCRQEFGALNAVQGGLSADEALITVVADSEDPEAIRRFAKEHDLRYPILLASEDAIRDYRVSAFPTNYFIAPTGQVKAHTVGMATRLSLNARLALAR